MRDAAPGDIELAGLALGGVELEVTELGVTKLEAVELGGAARSVFSVSMGVAFNEEF
jgi:hypothetical protein